MLIIKSHFFPDLSAHRSAYLSATAELTNKKNQGQSMTWTQSSPYRARFESGLTGQQSVVKLTEPVDSGALMSRDQTGLPQDSALCRPKLSQ